MSESRRIPSEPEARTSTKGGPGKCKRCRKFMYNSETNQFCGRTCTSWFKVILYYILFILALFGIFWGVLATIRVTYRQSTGRPHFKKIYLSYGATPGMAFMPSQVNKEMFSIIWYKFKGEDSKKNRLADPYIQYIDKYIEDETLECKYQKTNCSFSRKNFGPCGVSDFGYYNKTPCVYLKMNKIDDWEPKPYTKKSDIPANTPPKVRNLIQYNKKDVYVNCEGDKAFDKDNIGNVDYYPKPAFDENYFPFERTSKLNPTIAIHLKNIKPGFLITLKCTMYAKNIISDPDAKTLLYLALE